MTLIAGGALAQEVHQTLGFARSLQAEGDYYRAITEYKRLLYLAPPESTAVRDDAILGIAGALFSGAEFVESAEWLHGHLGEVVSQARRSDVIRLMCRAYLEGGAGDRVLAVAREIRDLEPEMKVFEGLGYARLGQWSEAASTFRAICADPRVGPMASKYSEVASAAQHAHWKNPKLAAFLGVVPGLGYCYAGHRQTAVASFLVNSVFAVATVEAFRNDQDILGGFVALFAASWYAGNVYGSAGAARRYNAYMQNKFWSKLQY